jgi:predicted DNA-binding transcriptional regulator AlpA
MQDDKDAFGIPEFCRRHGFSQSFFFKLQANGQAPRTMKVGARRMISKEAAEAWRREREAASTVVIAEVAA